MRSLDVIYATARMLRQRRGFPYFAGQLARFRFESSRSCHRPSRHRSFLCLQTNADAASSLLSCNCMFSLKPYRFKFFKLNIFCTKISSQIMRFSISCYNKISRTLPQATASHNFNIFTIFYSHRGARGP